MATNLPGNNLSQDEAITVLRNIFGAMPSPREDKYRLLYDLASSVERGCIVELGTWLGGGTIALALGAAKKGLNIQIYTVDDFIFRNGWAGEPYAPTDRFIAVDNIFRASVANDVVFLNMSSEIAIQKIHDPIGLWFWDLGMDYGSTGTPLYNDFLAWESKIIDGGLAFLRDTFDKRFGSSNVIDEINHGTLPYSIVRDDPGFLIVMKNGK